MLKGQLIGERYLIKHTIGGGGMANVYLAEDTILNREVAIKVLRLEYANDEEFIKRFDREAQAATSLTHPNIVNIYDVGEEEHILYMVMEYVDGFTLKEYIQQNGPIPVEEALNIMKQITSAIARAHQSNLVHRDIKPQNILLDKKGNVKVTDFGIAVALSATALTQTNTILGSVHYLSPEQARGGMATKKSDIYSLGIVLYELLTGRLPFSGETPVAIALKHLQTDIPHVRDFNENIPQSVENIVLKAAAKDPFHRFETVQEMEEALYSALLPENLNEEMFTPPVEEGEETKAIPIITEEQMNGENEDETIVHPANEETKVTPEEKPKKKKSRKKKWFIFIGIILFILAATLTALFVWPGFLKAKDVTITDVIDIPYEEAKEELEELSLKTKKEEVYSDEIEEGNVVKTSPRAGRTVKENSEVTIFVSQGQETVIFDDFVGKNYEQTKRLLEDKGFEHISAEESYSDKPAGEIIAHIEPEAESEVIPSEVEVVFEVSIGEKTIDLESLAGMTEDDAVKYLKDHDLKANRIMEYSNDVKEGTVIRQSPSAGTTMKVGETVDIYISEGPEESPPSVHSVTLIVPYTGEDGEAQNVKVYIGDKDHNIDEVFTEEDITDDKEFPFTLTIEEGKEARYRVFRDDEQYIDKTVPY